MDSHRVVPIHHEWAEWPSGVCHVAKLSASDSSVLLIMLTCLSGSCLISGSYVIGVRKTRRLLEEKVGSTVESWVLGAGAGNGGGPDRPVLCSHRETVLHSSLFFWYSPAFYLLSKDQAEVSLGPFYFNLSIIFNKLTEPLFLDCIFLHNTKNVQIFL